MGELNLEILVAATPEDVFACWTTSALLGSWLCDRATVSVQAGGVYTLVGGPHQWAAGTYEKVEPSRYLRFSWHDAAAPGATQIGLVLDANGEGTRLQLTQTGFGVDTAWNTYRTNLEAEWKGLLENLRVTAETGADARFLRRPLIGLSLFPINDGYAEANNLPFDKAMHVTVVFENTPAENAGLRPGDYLVEIDGVKQTGFGEYLSVLGKHKAGDSVRVVYYRESEMRTTEITFDARKPEVFPATREMLYQNVSARVAQIEDDLEALIAGVPEDALAQKPAPDEWSVNETLAHMVWAERWYQQVLWILISYGEHIPWGVNNRFQLDGILATHPTTTELMAELRRSLHEQVVMINAIPDTTLSAKPLFHQIAGVLSYTGEHCRRHYTQISSAIDHVRKTQAV